MSDDFSQNKSANRKPTRRKMFRLVSLVSEDTADFLYWGGQVLLVLVAFAGAAGAVAMIVGDRARERFSNELISENNKQMSQNKLETAEARKEAEIAKKGAAEASQRAAEANLKSAEAGKRAAEAEQRAAEANEKAEKERVERLRLEQELSPRWFKDQHSAIERLRAFKGTDVIMKYPPDLECARTAEQIAYVLKESGWNINPQPVLELDAICQEGITVETLRGSLGSSPSPPGEVLAEVLNSTDCYTKIWPFRVTSDVVVVWIGMKPNGLSGRIMKYTAAMEKEKSPDDTIEKLFAAIQEQTKGLTGGFHGNRLLLPRWPLSPPCQP